MPPERRPPPRHAVFVTYTMANPFAVGVFFRALRLCFELRGRGWRATVCNLGPIPDDPKVDAARGSVDVVDLAAPAGADETAHSYRTLRDLAPDVVVFGEEPFPGMDTHYRAARMLDAPFVVLDQFYDEDVNCQRFGVDLVLLYGIRALWESAPADRAGFYCLVPPFIDEVTPTQRLPVPDDLPDAPWVTIVGFDERVLRGGLDLIAGLDDPLPVVITLSHDPHAAGRMMADAGVPQDRRVAMPLRSDADLFGFIASSRAAILANGFMQIVEALALGCPAICIHRGIGMDAWGLAEDIEPWVSMQQSDAVRRERLRGWLAARPFSAGQLDALRHERHGARVGADHIERVAARPRLARRLQRLASRLRWQLAPARSRGAAPLPAQQPD